MSQLGALKETIKLADQRGMQPKNAFASLSLDHLRDMVVRIEKGVSHQTQERWLNWAQLAVVASGVATLTEMEAIREKHAQLPVWCDQCAGPYKSPLLEQYGGHWDTCPNRSSPHDCTRTPPPITEEQIAAAVAEWNIHIWDASTRLCTCGAYFEAIHANIQVREMHRMLNALAAARAAS